MELLTALKVIDGYGLTVTKVRNAGVVAEIRNGKSRGPTRGKKTGSNGRVPVTDAMLDKAHSLRKAGKNWRECADSVHAGSANGLQAAYGNRYPNPVKV